MPDDARYLRPRPRVSVPEPTPIAQALRAHASLAQLGQRMDASRRRLRTIAPALPGDLMASLEAGPLDESGWCLLAANAAVAAKVRQLLPRLEALLAQAGFVPSNIRIRLIKK